MDLYLKATITMLAVINPVVCGGMLYELLADEDVKSRIFGGVKAMLAVLVVLLTAAIIGKYILDMFGISMDAFRIVGGLILAFIGFQMLGGMKNDNSGLTSGLTPLVLFAASPGSIAMVITISAIHGSDGLPITTLVGTSIAVAFTLFIMTLMQLIPTSKNSGSRGMISRFMGLIVAAMGLQFFLDGIQSFFNIG
jgi:multiple antibiotic resistance protein